MDKVSFGGKTYVKASVIARELGYTTDYVGQLCRSEKVDCQLIGRSWYVEIDSIKNHKSTRYRSTKAATQKTIKKQLQETEDEEITKAHFYTHDRNKPTVSIQYDTDDVELFPSPKKEQSKQKTNLPVELADARDLSIKAEPKKYHFEAPEKEEIQFHGTLRVTEFNSDVLVTEDTEDREPQKVTVTGAKKKEHIEPVKKKLINTAGAITMSRKRNATLVTDIKLPHENAEERKNGAVQVNPEQSSVDIGTTVSYKLTISSAFVVAILAAVLIIGLEVHVKGNDTQTIIEYTFVIKEVFASLYLSL